MTINTAYSRTLSFCSLALIVFSNTIQAVAVVEFNADQVTTAVNQFQSFNLNENTATINPTSSAGYTGPPVYCAFEEQGNSFLAASPASGSGLKLRWNTDAGVSGEPASGLFLFKKIDFLNGLNAGSVKMDAANDSIQLSVGWINPGTVATDQAIASASVRIVIKDNSGYHISALNTVSSGQDLTLEATELTYSAFDPFNHTATGAGTVLNTSSPTFSGIQFIGFRLDATRGQDTSLGGNFGLLTFTANARHAPINVSLTPATRHQTMEGFGAAGAWIESTLYNHDSRAELIDLLFKDLNLDIYRLRNVYDQGTNYVNKIARDAAIIALAETARQQPLKILISGWSPPDYLKSNNSTKNGGTIAKDINGNYRYNDYAQWWDDSLQYYSSAGIEITPAYISIQNEPNWTATHDTNRLDITETATEASYDTAFEAVWQKLNTRMGASMPKMIGPETVGLRKTDEYIDSLSNPAHVYGYAHHLYEQSVGADPDVLLTDMADFQANYNDKPIFQTEYFNNDSTTPWLRSYNLAKLMHNSLTVEGVSAYFYWGLFWSGDQGLINLDGTSAYSITPEYYAFKHYSAFINANWQRIGAQTSKNGISTSAFINPNEDQASVVILNALAHAVEFTPNIDGCAITALKAYRSSATENCLDLGALNTASPINIPANSITTLSLNIELGNSAPSITLLTPDEVSIPAGVGLMLEAQISDDDLPTTAAPTTTWSTLSAPAGGTVIFDDPTALQTGATFNLAGDYQLQFEADDSERTSTQSMTVHYDIPSASLQFTSQDIGAVAATGSASVDGDVLTINGSGGDIWNSADEFHFYHTPLNGDGSLIARLVSQGNTNSWAKAGLMIRDSLDANSSHSMIAITPGNGIALQSRLNTNENSNNTAGGSYSLPVWLKLSRKGSTITTYKSSDGANWIQVGTLNPNMSGSDYIGFAVTSHDNGVLGEVQFDQLGNDPLNQGPTITIPSEQTTTVREPTTLSATITDDDKPTTDAPTTQWTQLAGPSTLTFITLSETQTDISGHILGEYSLRLIADDGTIKTFNALQLTVHTQLTAWKIAEFGDSDAPQAALTADPNGNGLSNLLEFAFGGDPNSTVFQAINTSPLSVIDYQFGDPAHTALHTALNRGTDSDASFNYGGPQWQTDGNGHMVTGFDGSVGTQITATVDNTDTFRSIDGADGMDALSSGQYRFSVNLSEWSMNASNPTSSGIRFIVGTSTAAASIQFDQDSHSGANTRVLSRATDTGTGTTAQQGGLSLTDVADILLFIDFDLDAGTWRSGTWREDSDEPSRETLLVTDGAGIFDIERIQFVTDRSGGDWGTTDHIKIDAIKLAPVAHPLRPEQQTVKISGQDYLNLTYRRQRGSGTGSTEAGYTINGITYTVQTSPSLNPANWQTGNSEIIQTAPPTENADGTESVTVRLVEPIDSVAQPKAFMRVSVEVNE